MTELFTSDKSSTILYGSRSRPWIAVSSKVEARSVLIIHLQRISISFASNLKLKTKLVDCNAGKTNLHATCEEDVLIQQELLILGKQMKRMNRGFNLSLGTCMSAVPLAKHSTCAGNLKTEMPF